MSLIEIKDRIRQYLPGFYAHLIPMIIMVAVFKFLIMTGFLVDISKGLFIPIADLDVIFAGIILEALPVTLMVLLFYLATGMGRWKKTLLSLQAVLMVLDVAGLYFFASFKDWFKVEDFHLLQGASFSSAGDLINAEVPLLLLFIELFLAVFLFLFLYKKMAVVFAKKFAVTNRKRSRTRNLIHAYLLISLMTGSLNSCNLPLFNKVSLYGNNAVTRLVGSFFEEQFESKKYTVVGGPAAFNYRWIRRMLYRADDFSFPQQQAPFVRVSRTRDQLQPGVLHGGKRYNVILFVLESLSSFAVGSRFKGKVIAPSLAALQQQGLNFSRFYTSGFPSARGQEAIFYSLYPPMIDGYCYGAHQEISFVQRLQRSGYQTGCFSSSFYQPLRASGFFRRSGHAFYQYPAHFGIRPKGRIAAETKMLDAMYSYIQRRDKRKPFMLTFLSEMGHSPYWYYPFSSKIKMLFPHDKSVEARYATQIHFVGESVARFIRRVQKLPVFRDTIFIITADHFPHKALDLAALSGRKINSRDYWHQLPLVPLIIYAPGIVHKNRSVEGRPGGQIDLGPTILQLVGIQPGTTRSFGQSLVRKQFNYDRYVMLHGKDAIYDNYAINEQAGTVQQLPVLAGSLWSRRITPTQLIENYRIVRRCLREYRRYYQQAVRTLPLPL